MLNWCAASFGELDGTLILAGLPRGILGLTPRQLCNTAFALCTRDLNEQDRMQWLAELNTTEDPWAAYTSHWASIHNDPGRR